MGRLEYEQNLPDLIYFGFGNFSFGRKTFELFLLAQRPLKEKKIELFLRFNIMKIF
jgi:hypothetical protein